MASKDGGKGKSKDDRDMSSSMRLQQSSPKMARPRTGSLERLPSLKPKRDLTLGGVPKRTFVPTIPPRRIKKEPVDTPPPPPPSAGPKTKPGADRGRGKGKERRRGKEVVTTSSVFSMGPSERSMERKRESLGARGRGGGGEGGGGWVRPKKERLDLDNHKMAVDTVPSDEEPMDTSTSEDLFPHSRLPPIQLPLDCTRHTVQRALPLKQAKVKVEPKEEQTDEPSDSLVTSKPAKPVKQVVIGRPVRHEMTAEKLFTPSEDSKGQFLFLQLPDCLPLPTPPASNGDKEEATSQNGAPSSARESPSSTSGSVSEPATPQQRHCTLQDVPEGYIGKLRVHKSGKVKLILGDVTLDVAMGTPCGFLQQLATIKREQEAGPEMTVVGQLSHRLVCTPDFEAMLEGR